MNLGIVIGVSEYEWQQDLLACETDARAMKKLFDLTKKCQETLFIIEETNSKSIKSKVSAFIEKHKDKEIEEVIFYFSGHGMYEDGEFYYVLTDFSDSKKAQTSLENTELDSLLKSLSANLTVKIVDACQSGTRYIKESSDDFQKFLKKSEDGFKKCYFLYSSHQDQKSYQDDKISDFTHGIIKAVITRPDQEVRYKDIMDTLTDEFSHNKSQTPFFIVQASYTEKFSYVDKSVIEELEKLFVKSTKEQTLIEDSNKSLIQFVEQDAQLYCTEKEATESLESLFSDIEKYNFSQSIHDLFEFSIVRETETPVPVETDFIGKYFRDNDQEFLISIQTETRTRLVPKDPFSWASLLGNTQLAHNIETVKQEYLAPVGAISNVKLPFKFIRIKLTAKHPNIDDRECIIIPYLSRTKFVLFSCFYQYRAVGWKVKEIEESSHKWLTYQDYIKKEKRSDAFITDILENFSNYTILPIKEFYNLLEESSETDKTSS